MYSHIPRTGQYGGIYGDAGGRRYSYGHEPGLWRTFNPRFTSELLRKYFHIVPYGVNDEGYIDYDEVEKLAMENKPKLIVAGASAYARVIDFKRFRGDRR